jgi:hypothetical protein
MFDSASCDQVAVSYFGGAVAPVIAASPRASRTPQHSPISTQSHPRFGFRVRRKVLRGGM